MVKIKIKKLDPKVKIPQYKAEGSSGMDLMAFVKESLKIKPNSSELIPTGISIAIPQDTEIQIRPRSGLAAKSHISVLNTPGTIDSDYRGELKVILFNHGVDDFIVNNGDRIAQMVLMPVLKASFEEVDELPDTVRGSGGFGSTGKLSLIHISEPTRQAEISYAVFCLKKKNIRCSWTKKINRKTNSKNIRRSWSYGVHNNRCCYCI